MKKQILLTLLLTFFSTITFAHPGHEMHHFVAGFIHPFSGIDHLLVMVAVGLLASKVGKKAAWQMPMTFLAAMIGGVLLGTFGVNVAYMEAAIASTLLLMSVLLYFYSSHYVYFLVVAAVAILHGMAHGVELDLYQHQVGLIGMLLATSALLAVGLMINQQHYVIKRMMTHGLAVVMVLMGGLLLLN